MRSLGLFNFRTGAIDLPQPNERLVIQKALDRILAFTGLTIDDVVNSPIARNKVRAFYKLHRWIDRESDILDLERQWNPTR